MVYRANLALLEVAVCAPPSAGTPGAGHAVEPLDEDEVQADLDGDGLVGGMVTRVRALPAHYVGAASSEPVRHGEFPAGTELLRLASRTTPSAAPGWHGVRVHRMRKGRQDWHYSASGTALESATTCTRCHAQDAAVDAALAFPRKLPGALGWWPSEPDRGQE